MRELGGVNISSTVPPGGRLFGNFFAVPRVPRSAIERGRLIERLDGATHGSLTVVRGGAGIGKSTALAQWALRRADTSTPGLWLTVETAASNRFSFWRFAIDSLIDSGVATPGSALAAILPGADTDATLRQLLLRGFRALPDGVLIVIDDFHLLADERVQDDLVWLLLQTDALRVVVSTRTRGTLEDPEPTARLDTTVLSGAELLFTAEETGAVVLAEAGPAGAGSAADLHRAMGGWPLATRAALRQIDFAAADSLDPIIGEFTSGGIAARIIDIVMDSPDPGLRTFAVRIALAEYLTTDLASALSPGSDVTAHLRWLEHEGLGSWQRAGGTSTFRVQPLVRAALEVEAARSIAADLPDLRCTLAHWLNDNERPLDALRQSVMTDDWDFVVDVCKRHFVHLLRYHRTELRAILDALPQPQFVARPLLVILKAVIHYSTETTPAERLTASLSLGIALAGTAITTATPVDRMWLTAALMGAQRMAGRYEQAASTADRLLALTHALTGAQERELRALLPFVFNHAAVSYLFANRPDETDALFDEAIEHSRLVGDTQNTVMALSMRSYRAALVGDLPQAAHRIDAARTQMVASGWQEQYSSVGLHLAEALVSLERFDGAAALESMRRTDPIATTVEFWPMLLRVEALAMLTQSMPFEAVTLVNRVTARMARRPQTSAFMQAALAATQADLFLSTGQLDRARRALGGRDTAYPQVAFSTARIALATGRPEEALRLGGRLAWSPLPRVQAEALLIHAVAAHRLRNDDAAQESLDRALVVLTRYGLRRPLMMLPRQDLLDVMALRGTDATARLEGVPDVFSRTASGTGTKLTPRELRVLAELAKSTRLEAIAAALYVSPNTVKTQLRSVYRKLGVASRDEALAVAHDRGLFDAA